MQFRKLPSNIILTLTSKFVNLSADQHTKKYRATMRAPGIEAPPYYRLVKLPVSDSLFNRLKNLVKIRKRDANTVGVMNDRWGIRKESGNGKSHGNPMITE